MSHDDPYRELFDRSADAILIIEGEQFVDCNAAAVEMLRCQDRAHVLRTHPSELSPPTQPDGRDSFRKSERDDRDAFEYGSHRFEWMHKRADGEVFPVEVLLTAVNEPDRQVLHVVWRDITDRKQLESQLLHAQKMEGLGKLAGGIAHDFNNLLVVIFGNCDLISLTLGANSEVEEHVMEIRDTAQRASALIQQLLTFSRKQEVEVVCFDLVALVEDLEAMLRRFIGEDVVCTLVTGGPAVIEANPGSVEQVVFNLFDNARDAMPDGGHLRLDVSTLRVGSSDGLGVAPGDYVRLQVRDTGVGMTEATRLRAFDPFFSTKAFGEGTGLGLATVYGVVEQSGGHVELDSAPGEGTTVTIYLPLVEALTEIYAAREARAEIVVIGGDETLLLVEDDEAVAALTYQLLCAAGYTVFTAVNGEDALAVFDAHAHEIALIVSDIVMPKLSGPDFVVRLRERGVDVPVLFVSGYTDAALRRVQAIGEEVDLLEKPFTATSLTHRVRAALDRPPS